MPREKDRVRIPRFIRQESWRYKRVKNIWRRPRGASSRMRRKVRGWPRTISIGYAGKRETKGLHPSGLREVRVFKPSDLDGLNPKKDAVKISRNVGEKKRLEIMDRAEEMNLKVLNPTRIEEREEGEIEGEEEPEVIITETEEE